MTPRLAATVLRHARRLMRITDLQAGMVACSVANFGPYPPKKAWQPKDFSILPQSVEERRAARAEEEKPVDIADKLHKLFGGFSINS